MSDDNRGLASADEETRKSVAHKLKSILAEIKNK